MLFESGNGVMVNLSLYPLPKDSNRPIDAYIVTETAGDFTKSARRAAAAVYDILQHKFPAVPQKVVGFDLQGYTRATVGESGGLAFAIALAKKLLNQDPGPVAATGEITSGHQGGQLGPIKGIVAKINAAEQLLPENGWLFYPLQNDAEVPDGLRKSLTEKGIKLHPVSSVSEVLALLFGWDMNGTESKIVAQGDTVSATGSTQDQETRKTQAALWPLLVLFLVIAGMAAWFYFPESNVNKDTGSAQITTNPAPETASAPEAKPPEKDIVTSSVPESKPVTPPSANQVTVDFNSDSPMAAELAKLLNEQLPQYFSDNDITFPHTTISGIVKIIENNKEIANEKDDVHSSMTAVLSKLNSKSKDSSRSYPDLRISVQSKGQAGSLLPLAAIEFSNVIANTLNPDIIIKNKGFE